MSEPTAHDLRRFIEGLLDEVGPLVAGRFGTTGPLRFKVGREAITEVDALAEDLLTERILARFPDHAVHGEERGLRGPLDSAWRWHLDPIDGTLNYAIGVPAFSVSVAVVHADQILAGGVLDPLRGERFTAGRGDGAWCGEQLIRVSQRSPLSEAIASTQLSKGSLFHRNPALLQGIHDQTLKTRRLGSIALELAYVACGRFDLLLAGKKVPQNLYDVAGGLLLVEEAGGTVTDATGQPFRSGSVELIASNGLVHAEALALVAPYLVSG